MTSDTGLDLTLFEKLVEIHAGIGLLRPAEGPDG